MKASDQFKTILQNHLNERAAENELFAETLKKENKNIDDCITYILNQVKNSGCNGFADEEIFNMAVHYYDEDDLKPGKKINAKVVVNHVVEISEDEKQVAKQKALDELIAQEKERITSSKPKKSKEVKPAEQGSLF